MSDDDERGNGQTGLSQQLGDADIAGSDDDGEALRDDELLDYEEEPAHDAAKTNVASAKKSAKKTEAKQVVKDEATGKMDTTATATIPTQCIKDSRCCKMPQFPSGKHLGFCTDSAGKKVKPLEEEEKAAEAARNANPMPPVEGIRVIAGRGMRGTAVAAKEAKKKKAPSASEASSSAYKEAEDAVFDAEKKLLAAKKAKLEALKYEIKVEQRELSEKICQRRGCRRCHSLWPC